MSELRIRVDAEQKCYRPLYRSTCIPDREWQRCYLESLRYKWRGYRHAPRLMQWLGDIWRRFKA